MPDSSPSTETRITSSRRLMINTVLNLMNQVVTVIVNFAMVGFFLDTLGEERYGIWILVGSIFSYRNLMSMGLNSAVNRNIPVHLARGDLSAVAGVVSTAFAYFLAPAYQTPSTRSLRMMSGSAEAQQSSSALPSVADRSSRPALS